MSFGVADVNPEHLGPAEDACNTRRHSTRADRKCIGVLQFYNYRDAVLMLHMGMLLGRPPVTSGINGRRMGGV